MAAPFSGPQRLALPPAVTPRDSALLGETRNQRWGHVRGPPLPAKEWNLVGKFPPCPLPPHSFFGSVPAGGGGRARPLPTPGTPRRAGGSRTFSRPAPTRSLPAPTRPSRRRRSPPGVGPAAAAAPPILFCSAPAGRIPRADPTYPQRQQERVAPEPRAAPGPRPTPSRRELR